MLEEKKLTDEQFEELAKALKENNNLEFNSLKLVEEMQELGEVLLKTITKKTSKPTKEKIIEELGDVLLRSMVLIEQLDIENEVENRVEEKSYYLYKALKENNLGAKLIINYD